MEYLKLLLEYIKVLVWPIVTVVLAFTFKDSLMELLSRLQKADLPGDVSLDFTQNLEEAKELSRKVEETPMREEHKNVPTIPLTDANSRLISVGLQPSPSGLDMNYYRELANQDPNLALAGLRMEVDVLARNLAKGFNINIKKNDGGMRILDVLYHNGAIYKEQMMLAKKVLSLCNAAIHGKNVSKGQALDVIDLTDVLKGDYIRWLSWGFPDGWQPPE
ncbi:MAG: hypothetical protein WGN25_16910 [Candidatus Electrothrix sp. GW3-4]|uniref:hypothetical protein n=1 Tax=Candidatus Electrothrix sp. GW3-4 TaxID=3126740 RepID=UPI0030D3DE04